MIILRDIKITFFGVRCQKTLIAAFRCTLERGKNIYYWKDFMVLFEAAPLARLSGPAGFSSNPRSQILILVGASVLQVYYKCNPKQRYRWILLQLWRTTTSLLQYQHITHDDNTTVLMDLIPNPTAVNSITASSLPTLPAATVIAIAVVQDCNLLCCLLVKDRKKIMSYY